MGPPTPNNRKQPVHQKEGRMAESQGLGRLRLKGFIFAAFEACLNLFT